MKTRKIPAEIFSRVVGYYRPVNQWNRGKQEEFGERMNYAVPAGTVCRRSDKLSS